jgi:predicted DNA-binding protein
MTSHTAGTTRYTLDLPKDLHRRLRLKALHEGRPASELCRDLIEHYLDDSESQDVAHLRAAYEAGVRAERDRIANAVQPPLATTAPKGARLPTRPPLLVQTPRQG